MISKQQRREDLKNLRHLIAQELISRREKEHKSIEDMANLTHYPPCIIRCLEQSNGARYDLWQLHDYVATAFQQKISISFQDW